MKIKTYLHNANSGDLIAALAGIRQVYRDTGKKAVVYQQLNFPGYYMPGIDHSIKDEKGAQVTMNKVMFDMLRPLLLAQEYIEDFRVHNGEEVEIDLPAIRETVEVDEFTGKPTVHPPKAFVNIPNMALPGWLPTAFPPMTCDISKPWIETPGLTVLFQSRILVNRTERYKNSNINYAFLKKVESELCFVGTAREHAIFCKEFKLDFPRLDVEDFLELAEIMKMCRFFIGNQSFCWNLANAMGVPRMLEMYHLAPNCQTCVGEDNYGAMHSIPFELCFDILYKKKAAQYSEQLSEISTVNPSED